jgi:FkbM family methyltransferase
LRCTKESNWLVFVVLGGLRGKLSGRGLAADLRRPNAGEDPVPPMSWPPSFVNPQHMTPASVKTILDSRGKPLEFLDEPGAEFYIRAVLSGHEYPAVYPEVFKPQSIVDVGAHVGSAALYFRCIYPQARIYCFEPNPISFQLLQRNVAQEPDIRILQCALGPDDSRQQLYQGIHSSLQASLVPNEENRSSGPMVEVRGVNSALDEMHIAAISVLKVDTEGMEAPILRALKDRLTQVEVIYLEYHSERDRRDLDAFLSDRFTLFASHADFPDRGSTCYVAADSLNRWHALGSLPRFAFPKQPM